ncbi:MAG: energy-coupling factor ABC transporter ATP-binding protein [Campylobacterales bacterium]
MNVLNVQNLTFGHAGLAPLFAGLNLTLKAGEKTGIIGDNGCGKSTLLRVICGLETPQSGTIALFEKPMRAKADFKAVYGDLGLLFQNSDDQLFYPTVIEDVAFGPLNQGWPIGEATEKARQALEQTGLSALCDAPIHTLSGGQKRLVALAGLLAMQPKLLLLDEPEAALDIKSRTRVIELLRNLDAALLIVSHDWDFLQSVCTRTLGMESGKLAAPGTDTPHTHTHLHPHGNLPHAHG